jgi:hypothetical protein
MIHDDADHHLVEVRPVVLAMTTLAEHVAGEVHIATKRGQAGVLLQRLIELVENDHIHTAWAVSRTAFCSAQAARTLAARTGPMPSTSRNRSGVAR